MRRWLHVGIGFAAFGLCGCPKIPATAVTLSDELYQYQKDQIEHLKAITAASQQVLHEEARRQLAPLTDLERSLQQALFEVEGYQIVEADPSQPVPAEWADNAKVVAFRELLRKDLARWAEWEPWVRRARTYQGLLVELKDPNTGQVPYTHTILSDGSRRPQRVIVEGLVADDIDGVSFPAAAEGRRSPLKRDWNRYLSAPDDRSAGALGSKVDTLIAATLTESRAQETEAFHDGLRAELVQLRAGRQDLLHEVRRKIQERRMELETLTSNAVRNLEAVQTNAAEIARGLDALSTGLRRGHEAVYRPKQDIVTGLQSLAGNLGELGMLDEEDVAKFNAKADSLSNKFDEYIAKLGQLGA